MLPSGGCRFLVYLSCQEKKKRPISGGIKGNFGDSGNREATNKYNTLRSRITLCDTSVATVCSITHVPTGRDLILCAAHAHSLPKHEVNVGLTNRAAA